MQEGSANLGNWPLKLDNLGYTIRTADTSRPPKINILWHSSKGISGYLRATTGENNEIFLPAARDKWLTTYPPTSVERRLAVLFALVIRNP